MKSPLLVAFIGLLNCVSVAQAVDLGVLGTSPLRNVAAPTSTTIAIVFDRPIVPSSVNASSFRVFGRGTGGAAGTFSFSVGNQVVTFTPASPFIAGELVSVNLSHDIDAADATSLRAAGYFYSFMTAVAPSGTIQYQELDILSNLEGDPRTRIYGAAATDLNNDGYLDLATVNEVSADIRVALNRADGSGLYHDFLTPVPIGIEASPNDPGDFNNDGNVDLCVSATGTDNAWILLGAGDGSFSSVQSVAVGSVPHGIVALDVDGDADWDIVNANEVDNNLSLMINNGAGVFGPATFFDAGVNGEYGLAAGDMNEDGICDLVVAGEDGQQIVTLRGNGNGTFTAAAAPVTTGGYTWVVVLGDLNADGHLDAVTANAFSNNVGILRGTGLGTFLALTTHVIGAHTPSVDLGDLDGDGDADLIASCFGGGYWRFFTNNGAGALTFFQDLPAPSNPSCAGIFDFDNDADLDLALFDEIDDVIVLMENVGNASGVAETVASEKTLRVAAFPNPFSDRTRVRFLLPEPEAARIDIVDVSGRIVRTERIAARGTGWHEFEIEGTDPDLRALPAGVYFVRLSSGGRSATTRVVRVD